MKTPILLALALTLTFTACDGGSVNHIDEGYKAAGANDHAAAVSHFDQALATLGPDNPEKAEVALKRCNSFAFQDAAAARAEFLEMAGTAELTAKDYTNMARSLFNAGGTGGMIEAVTVVDAGIKKFPDSDSLKAVLAKLQAEASKAEGGALSEALKGLGYA